MEFHHEHEEDDDEEIPLPINTTYGHNHIVPLSLHHHKPSFTDVSSTISPPPPPPPPMEIVVKYKECLRNHAASMGGKARDGCGEFMPSGEEGTLEALTCSVCNCHRNFHRKEIEGDNHHHYYDGNHRPSVVHPHLKRFDLGNGRNLILQGHNSKGVLGTESLGFHHHNNEGSLVPSRGPPPMIMPYNMGMGMGMWSYPTESDHQENGVNRGVGGYSSIYPPVQAAKKRFRTKFTQEQKEKMFKFAENAGWKIQRQEESVVQDFCQEIGIKRRVLKVWMHNNKQSLAKSTNSLSINPPQDPNN
ncbi:hypothetical protein L1987_54791 [Smallanthus sonchifolius]|uniref:Uncharacterized protein n=1 Tax=Smallanthus sonchifolius TaxID=185202 RepID=A0ACB9E7Y4_9ASTR|nr:hypothetical protein L1987_54791 [Smallanthus sonchifolius]